MREKNASGGTSVVTLPHHLHSESSSDTPFHRSQFGQNPPTTDQVARAIWSLKCGKAAGPDQVTAELMRAGGWTYARQLQGIMYRIWTQLHWPVEWRGGRIKELPKKGARTECENHRGILISSHASKVGAKLLATGIDERYARFVPEHQCGGVPKKGTDMPNHMIRLGIPYAAAHLLSIAIVFIDVVKAFDMVVRELIFGWFDEAGLEDDCNFLRQGERSEEERA